MRGQVRREMAKQVQKRREQERLRGRDYLPWEGFPHTPAKVDAVLSASAQKELTVSFWADCLVPSIMNKSIENVSRQAKAGTVILKPLRRPSRLEDSSMLQDVSDTAFELPP
jgi:hypothetical protein